MPYVRVDILEGLSTAQKLAIHKGITDLLVKVAGKNPDYTFIAINEVPDENWGHKGTSIAELKKAGSSISHCRMLMLPDVNLTVTFA